MIVTLILLWESKVLHFMIRYKTSSEHKFLRQKKFIRDVILTARIWLISNNGKTR